MSRIRSLRAERYDSTTGRRRHGGVAVAAGVALALFVGSGIAVAAVSSVDAHVPAIDFDCTGVWVDATLYNPALANTVTVTIVGGNPDGSDQVETRTFGEELHEKFPFPDPSLAWTFTATIDAPDGANGTEWDLTVSDTTVGCATPGIALTATTCVHAGDLTTVDAQLASLDTAHAYTVQLTGTNGYDSGAAPILTNTASWSGLDPGYDYTATLVDTTTGLTGSDTVHAIGCPQPPDFQVTITQCTAVGGSGAFGVTVSGLVIGRDYVLALVNTAGGAPTAVPFTATAATYSDSFTTAPSGTYFVRITDVADGGTKESSPVTYLPCPGTPDPVLDPTQCTSTGGVSDASMVSTVDLLVPGRSYSITVVTGATTAYSESLTPATSSTWTKTLVNLDPGVYTLTVTDTTDPASAGFTASTTATLLDCPSQQEVDLDAQQCSVPGGSGTLTATVTNFTIGRNYTVALIQNGLPVTGQLVSQDFDPVAATPGVFTYTGLRVGLVYRVVVADVTGGAASLPIAANDILITDCPGNPDVILTQPTCTAFTTSTITVGAAKLIPGETYTVAVTTTANGAPVPGVPDQQLAATTPTASFQFTNLPVGKSYTITVTNLTKTLTATGTILLTLCDLPTLAYTGASTMTPTLAGLGFLQFGLVLVGISLVRRRSGAREV